jgi:F0F1-type ATP synthase assembly protein I
MAPESASWSTLLGLGAVIGAALVVGMGAGWLVDSAAGTGPVFVVVGLAVGLVGGIAYAVRQFRQYLKT